MKKILVIIVSIAFVLGMATLAGCGSSDSSEEPTAAAPTAAAPTGTYIGNDNDGVQEFLGIRYGEMEPFRAPTDVTTTTEDEIEATNWGYNCLQPVSEVELASQDPCSQDCLFLNVWTKDVTTTDKPVIVWIHGAGTQGGTSDPCYDGEFFVRNLPEGEDCVFVSMNFRISFMGACDLSSLEGYTDEYADAINLTKLDQTQALKWINENIEAFGGDPGRITVMGHSSGGASLQALMADPETNKYFKRAVECSGVMARTVVDKEAMADFSKKTFEILGVKSIDDICALTDEQILENLEEINHLNTNIWMGGRCADGKIISETWWDDLRNGSAKDIDLMIGSVDGEEDYHSIDFENGPALAKDSTLIKELIKERDAECPNVYGRYYVLDEEGLVDDYLALGDDEVILMQDIWNNIIATYPTYVTAEEQSKWNENTYLYYWEYRPDPESVEEYAKDNAEVSPFGRAMHTMDICFFFGTKEGYVELTGDPAQMSDEVIQKAQMSLYNFAKNGNPNNDVIDTEWKPFSEDDQNFMVVTEDGNFNCEKDYRAKEMDVMSKLRPYGEQ